jgi:GT2 family glycosyltransferase
MLDLSIVLPTCNRAGLLEKAMASIEAQTRCSHEVIVVDGASNDPTQAVLAEAKHDMGDRLVIIREEQREGFVKAVNKGFKAARGRYLTWLNDDTRPLSNALDRAIGQLETESENVAFVAMFHRWSSARCIAYETWHAGRVYRLCHIRGTLYANFAMGKTSTYQKLDWFDERYYLNGADPDLSLKAWNAGMKIVPAYGAVIDHDEVEDIRRATDSSRANEDNEKLFAKWQLPPKNPFYNDFDPARPCTLQGLRTGVLAQAA